MMLVPLSCVSAVLSHPRAASASFQHLGQQGFDVLSHNKPKAQVASLLMWARGKGYRYPETDSSLVPPLAPY